jgi:hypothetical protein
MMRILTVFGAKQSLDIVIEAFNLLIWTKVVEVLLIFPDW